MPQSSAPISPVRRYRITPGHSTLAEDRVVVEEPLQIWLSAENREPVVFSTLLRTPGTDEELLYGLLFSEGIIERADEVRHWQPLAKDNANCLRVELVEPAFTRFSAKLAQYQRHYPSYGGCGLCGKAEIQNLDMQPRRRLQTVVRQLEFHWLRVGLRLLAEADMFRQTGGVHASVFLPLSNEGQLNNSAITFEDIGRHNALDKLIGHLLLCEDLKSPGILFLSGRLGYELMQKAIRAGIAIVIAKGAPSQLAIEMARRFDIALFGFAGEESVNLYSHGTLETQVPLRWE